MMNLNKYVSFFALLFLSVSFLSVDAQEEWKLSKEKDGMKIYTRKTAESSMKEYKGVVLLDASPEKILAVIKDVPSWDKVMYKCKEGSASILKTEGSTVYTYMQINSPWPAADRDVIAVYKFSEPAADGTYYIEFFGDRDFIPKKDGLIRIPKLIGYWKLIPQENGKTQVIHQALSEPGGGVPAGLANTAVVDAPLVTLRNLRSVLGE